MEFAGIDPDTIVAQLMAIERRPLTALQTRKTAATTASDAIGKIRSNLDAFRLAASKLADVSNFARFKTAVSHGDIASAAVTGTASAGSLSFVVDRLAQAHGLRSIGTVASDTSIATTADVLALATGTRSLGIDTVRAGAGLAAGRSTLEVTQASAGATTTGTALAGSTAIVAGVNDTVDLTVNGAARTVTLAAGTYDRTQLAAAVQAAIDATGGGVTAAVDGAGALELTTAREGSAASLRITGGTALTALGLTVQAGATTGTDGVVDVGGTLTTVSDASAGQAVAIATASGTIDVTLSGGLRVGETTVTTVSTGTKSLADVAAAINNANAGMSAAAVKVGDGAWRLQLTARSTGQHGRVAIDASVLSPLGGLIESSAAQDARITIGSGPGAYQVEAATNTFGDVLPGVSITARSVSATAVTVDVSRNDDAIATEVANLVGAANTLLADIKVQTRFDAVTRTSGALAGNSAIRRLAEQIRGALGGQVAGLSGASGNGLAASVGIQVTKTGDFTFDKGAFMEAIAADPGAVARLFSRGATATGTIEYAGATAETVTGTYDVVVTTAATRASTATLFGGGAAAPARIGVRVGSTTATVDVTAGQTPGQIVSSLNEQLVAAGLDVVAEIDGTGLRVRANGWGAAGSFEINTDVLGAGTWTATNGVDVQGTINGQTAIGTGRRLQLGAATDDPAAGLGVDVAGGTTGAVGSITYSPGLAARAVEMATTVSRDETGALDTVKDAADRRVKDLTEQMTRLEDRLTVRELNMRRQFSNLQTLLGNLQSQSSWLSSQISSLPTTNR